MADLISFQLRPLSAFEVVFKVLVEVVLIDFSTDSFSSRSESNTSFLERNIASCLFN
jgi:hypothetical protein